MEAVPAVSSSVERSSQNPLISLAPRLYTISHPNKCSKLENDEISGLTFTFFALLLELLLGVGFSVLLLTIPTRIAQALRGIYSMPLLISPIIVGLIWRYMFD